MCHGLKFLFWILVFSYHTEFLVAILLPPMSILEIYFIFSNSTDLSLQKMLSWNAFGDNLLFVEVVVIQKNECSRLLFACLLCLTLRYIFNRQWSLLNRKCCLGMPLEVIVCQKSGVVLRHWIGANESYSNPFRFENHFEKLP